MARDFAKAFYNSAAWLKCRAAYIKSVFGLCEKCREPGHIVHHKKELTPDNINDANITLNWDNLQYLCLDCHNRVPSDNYVTRDGLMFDEQGQLVPYSPLSK